ncbi:hypothetical protein LMJF_20_0990 [Leishmania major strain Friedlin]|uniref:Uncharacterized protein n=1 Tax=Leishmania major TaxID=5664 RepID=Q4QCU7_LEIMA|nr:hypothetical protein LMJF_20_0990 [Leishmania major strain Friedlin]CAG9573169.1 hypothetical_protein_-_conserved [Leishmania major strain Friedlin]CAJ04000.1 hypothetical protein LMJF_20_0990 [Leishmania major strain Friedlin]|eukprot:XP_001682851.1 hypothetical protein LMJF_20_0990 [Leishmania major strain Friedlin]
MRCVQLPMIRSCGLVLASIEASPRHALSGCASVASRTVVTALLCSRRWHAGAAAPSNGYAARAARRLPTAAEAEAELQAWASSAAGSSTLALTGKSLVLSVAALQLHEAAAATQDSTTSSTSSTELVHRYLGALAMHIYKHFNTAGKPSAAAVLYADVESAHIRPESLQVSVQYLAHKAFQRSISSASARDGAGQVTRRTAADLADTLSAERDLELTLEATLVLLAGHQILQVHLAAVAAKEVGTASTAAAMVPHAESTCYYVGNVVALISKPLQAPPTPSVEPAAALSLPPAKREFWAQTAKQLSSVLYVALLSAQSNVTDAQLIGQMFRDLLRRVYGVEGGTFGMRRALHYTLTVTVPYVLKSFAVILDVFQQQQRAAAERAAAAAEEGFGASAPTNSRNTSASSTGSLRPKKRVSTKAAGSATAVGPSSEKVHRATLLVLCVAAVLYMGSSRSDLFSAATPSSSSSSQLTAAMVQAADRGHANIQEALRHGSASATAPQLT